MCKRRDLKNKVPWHDELDVEWPRKSRTVEAILEAHEVDDSAKIEVFESLRNLDRGVCLGLKPVCHSYALF